MATKGVAKVYKHSRASTLYIAIPSDLATDTAFPFRAGDRVEISVDASNKRLVITALRDKKKTVEEELNEYRELRRRIGESIVEERTPDEVIAELRKKEY